jgi:hypothetical protein
MARTITSANAIFMLSVTDVFDTPVQLQGFSADDVFDTEAVDPVEVLMGVDGVMSAGFVYVPIKQGITLQADSDSNDLFEEWYRQQQAGPDIFFAQATIRQPAISKAYTCSQGVLSTYPSMADAKKVLQPRKYGITWERVEPAPL